MEAGEEAASREATDRNGDRSGSAEAMQVENAAGDDGGEQLWSQFHGHVPQTFLPYAAAAAEFQEGNKVDNNFLKTCRWSPDGLCVFASSDDNRIRVFELPPGARCQTGGSRCPARMTAPQSKSTRLARTDSRVARRVCVCSRRSRGSMGSPPRRDAIGALGTRGRDHLRRRVAADHVIIRPCELPLLFNIARQPGAYLGRVYRGLQGLTRCMRPRMRSGHARMQRASQRGRRRRGAIARTRTPRS